MWRFHPGANYNSLYCHFNNSLLLAVYLGYCNTNNKSNFGRHYSRQMKDSLSTKSRKALLGFTTINPWCEMTDRYGMFLTRNSYVDVTITPGN